MTIRTLHRLVQGDSTTATFHPVRRTLKTTRPSLNNKGIGRSTSIVIPATPQRSGLQLRHKVPLPLQHFSNSEVGYLKLPESARNFRANPLQCLRNWRSSKGFSIRKPPSSDHFLWSILYNPETALNVPWGCCRIPASRKASAPYRCRIGGTPPHPDRNPAICTGAG